MTLPPATDPARTKDDVHRVVVNDEEQYSIWPLGAPVPVGWHDTGVHGARDDCIAHIAQVWTDLRPRSVREHLGSGGAGRRSES